MTVGPAPRPGARPPHIVRCALRWVPAGAALPVMLSACPRQEPAADLAFRNGIIYTGEASAPRAQAVAIGRGRIVYVGSDSGLAAHVASGTRVIDLRGATVLPGLSDAHTHLRAPDDGRLRLDDLGSKAALLARLKEASAGAEPGTWIVGRGWSETNWKPPVSPTRWELDSVAPHHPVFLSRIDGHGALVNSRALEAAGVTRATSVPQGGALVRDSRGELTGMVLDDAQSLFRPLLPRPSDETRDAAVAAAAARVVSLGWTQVQEMGGSWSDVARLRRLMRDGRVKLRVYKAISGPGPAADSLINLGPATRELGGRLTVRTIKVVLDGALGSRGALLLAPYADAPKTTGLLTVDTAAYAAMLERARDAGVQVATHAIGDRANRMTLDFYERVLPRSPDSSGEQTREPRWRIEHASMVDAADVPRFAALGVIASGQPVFSIDGLVFAPRRVGEARMGAVYPWQRFLDHGVEVAGGTDAYGADDGPMRTFFAAVARTDLEGRRGADGTWHPEQRVSREDALRMFTLWPARAAFEEDVRGTIAVGKWGDLTVLDRDIMTIPELDILRTQALMTVIGGEIVHAAEGRP